MNIFSDNESVYTIHMGHSRPIDKVVAHVFFFLLGTLSFQHDVWWQFSALRYASRYEIFTVGNHRPTTFQSEFYYENIDIA